MVGCKAKGELKEDPGGGSQERRGEWYILEAGANAKGTSVRPSLEKTDGTLQRCFACKCCAPVAREDMASGSPSTTITV